MPTLFRDRFFIALILLINVTLFSSAIGGAGRLNFLGSPAASTTAVLGVAFAKMWVVMFNYMEVRNAPIALRLLCTGWLAVVLGGLLAIYAGVLY